MTVWGDKSKSPIPCVPNSNMQLSGGAVAQIGFEDQFETLDPERWVSNNATVENGQLVITQDGNNDSSFWTRFIAHQVADRRAWKNAEIIVKVASSGRTLTIGFVGNIDSDRAHDGFPTLYQQYPVGESINIFESSYSSPVFSALPLSSFNQPYIVKINVIDDHTEWRVSLDNGQTWHYFGNTKAPDNPVFAISTYYDTDECVIDSVSLRYNIETGSQISVTGIDGGFKEQFGSFDTSRWTLNDAVNLHDGKLSFNYGAGNGDLLRYVGFERDSVEQFRGAVIELKSIRIDDIRAFYIRFTSNNTFAFTDGLVLYVDFVDDENRLMAYMRSYMRGPAININNLFSLKINIDTDSIITVEYKQDNEQYREAFKFTDKYSAEKLRAFCVNQYYDNKLLEIDEINFYGYPEKSIATVPKSDGFKPLLPANLASLGAITPILLGEKKPNTAVYLEGQIYNDDLLFQLQQINPDATKDDDWASLDGKIGEWTRIAELENGVPVLPPEMLKGLDGEFRPQIVFETDGVSQPQSFAGFSMVWGSDVIAPDAPTIISIAQDGAGAVVLKIVDVFPADAMAAELEVNINNTGYKRVDVSNALSLDSDYMKFIGSTSNVQKAGQINANCHTISGLSLGDTVKFKARYIDEVGNASAFIESDTITISGTQYVRVPVTKLKPKRKQKRIARWKK